MPELAKKRPEFRNIHALSDLPSYRLPAAGWVSILHRISGVLMFALMPWAYLHHFIAGLRHLWMDVSHAAVTKEFGSKSATFTLAASVLLTLVLGAKLFGLY
jgi:succinate dehydrogenase / fumarate reductase cytochrome b subunit